MNESDYFRVRSGLKQMYAGSKDTFLYKVKKSVGIAVIWVFEQVIKLADGNKDSYHAGKLAFVKIIVENSAKIKKGYLQVAFNTYIPNFQEVSVEQGSLRPTINGSYFLPVYGYNLIEHLENCFVTTGVLMLGLFLMRSDAFPFYTTKTFHIIVGVAYFY